MTKKKVLFKLKYERGVSLKFSLCLSDGFILVLDYEESIY